jgi:hypothetical protein
MTPTHNFKRRLGMAGLGAVSVTVPCAFVLTGRVNR